MILIVVVISVAFFFLFGFANPKKDDAKLDFTLMILIIGRFFLPDLFQYAITLVIALIFLFLFDREALQKKRGVFFGLISIFFFFVICGSTSTGVIQIQEINWWRVLLLGISSAGAIRFWCFTKAEDNQYLAELKIVLYPIDSFFFYGLTQPFTFTFTTTDSIFVSLPITVLFILEYIFKGGAEPSKK